MSDSFKGRPWILTGGLAALIVVALLAVPISYTRVVGHDVSLTLANVQDVAKAAGIAKEMKSALSAENIMVNANTSTGGTALTFDAFVPNTAGVNAEARAQAMASALTARGFAATATTKVRTEKVSGSVYAYAKNLTIKIETEGKTAAQIEAEIRQQFAAAGVNNANVSVTDSDKGRKVEITAENHGEPGHEGGPGELNVQLTKNGVAEAIGDGTSVEIRKMRGPDGVTLHADVTSKGKTVSVDVPHVDTTSDAALAAQITSILKSAGVDLNVQVVGGKIQITDKP